MGYSSYNLPYTPIPYGQDTNNTDYITNILASLGKNGGNGSFSDYQGSPQKISQLSDGTYSYNNTTGWDSQGINSLLNGGVAGSFADEHNPDVWNRPVSGGSSQYGIPGAFSDQTFSDTGKQATQGDVAAHNGDPTYGFGAGGAGGYGKLSAQELGQGAAWPGFGQALRDYIIPAAISAGSAGLGGFAGAGLGLAGGVTGGTIAGGALGNTLGALATNKTPTLTGALTAGATSGLTSLAGQYFPETMNSLNPFSGSSSNVNPSGYSVNGVAGSPNMQLSAANVSPSSGGFFDNFFGSGSGSASNVAGNAAENISGAASNPSWFDQIGSYAANNPLTTGAGLLTAGAGISKALDDGGQSSPSSDIGSGLSSFTPQQQPGLAAPNSLANYTNSALSPDQTLSGIATQGVYGRGNGPEEQKYFLNLINNRLVDKSGQTANDMSGINPIENSYLAQLGLGGYQNPTDLLKGISNYAY